MDPITLRLNKMRREEALRESKSSDSKDRKDVENYLKYRLGSYETGITVNDIIPLSETPTTKTFRVHYSVRIQIPQWDDESETMFYDYDTEYRDSAITISKEGDLPKIEEDLTLNDDPEETEQKYSSAATSINSSKLPALFKLVKFEKGSLNLDYGGGRFDNVAEYLEKEYGATNLVYDKYNRSSTHNKEVLDKVRQNGGADTVTCSNVLNVIAEESERQAVLRNCKRFLKSGGTCYITVYEGSGTGEGAETKAGYQLNRKTAGYEEEIKKVFSNVTRKGKLFICR